MWWILVAVAAGADEAARAERGRKVEQQMSAVLTGWGAANLGAGLAVGLSTPDDPARSVALGSAAWNTVNLGLGIGGLVGARRPTPPQDAPARHRRLHRLLAINLALDAVYVGSGVALMALAPRDDLRGLGLALAGQGTFLAGFDAVYLHRHRRAVR